MKTWQIVLMTVLIITVIVLSILLKGYNNLLLATATELDKCKKGL